jgi:hypothetical protein
MPDMDFTWIVPLLSLITLLAVGVLALVSKVEVEERLHDPIQPVSTLAKDGPQGGVAFLIPLNERIRRVPEVEPVLD